MVQQDIITLWWRRSQCLQYPYRKWALEQIGHTWYPASFLLLMPQIQQSDSIVFPSTLYCWFDLAPSNIHICWWTIGSSFGTPFLGSQCGCRGKPSSTCFGWDWWNGGLMMMSLQFNWQAIPPCIVIQCTVWLSPSCCPPPIHWSHKRLLGIHVCWDMGIVCVPHMSLQGDTHVGDSMCYGSPCVIVHKPLDVEVSCKIIAL